ncbi:MAG: OB-fold domain-containing protein [Pseudomonadales bacterium]|nr:OB-fold domain-containing protein [Pseudomonadales bacterium]
MTKLARDGRPLPWPNPTTQPFFDAARDQQLKLQCCPRKGVFFYPRSRCPCCLADDWSWQVLSGKATVYSYTVDRMGHDTNLASRVPYVVAAVELAEGPRMTTNIVDCAPEEVSVGMPVEAVFEDVDDITLINFRPC